MTPVGAYLKKLLYQYDCLVVPELGAFLTHFLPATYTEASGQYLPPRKKLAFNEALRLDDGILINYMMLHEEISREEAQRKTAAFVADLKQEVRQNGSFTLEGIGLFTYNEESKLQFDPELRHNFYGESFGMHPIQAVELNQTILLNIDAVADEQLLEPSVEPAPELAPVVGYSFGWQRAAAAVLIIGTVGLISYFSVVNTGQPLQSSMNPVNILRMTEVLQAPVATTAPAETASIAVSSAAAIPAPVSNSTIEEKVPIVTAAPAVVHPVSAPVKSVQPKVKRDKALVEVRKKPKAPLKTYFHLIAGSFASRRNALKLQRILRRSGYASAYIINPSRKGDLFKVAALSSLYRPDMVSRLDTISTLTKTEPWILKNRQ